MNACGFRSPPFTKSGPAPLRHKYWTPSRSLWFSVRPGNGDAVAKTHQFRQHFPRRITGIALHAPRQFPGYPRKLRWKRRPRWHHAFSGRWLKKIVAPAGSSAAGSPDSALNRNRDHDTRFIGQNFGNYRPLPAPPMPTKGIECAGTRRISNF